jgi:hypothetical protein
VEEGGVKRNGDRGGGRKNQNKYIEEWRERRRGRDRKGGVKRNGDRGGGKRGREGGRTKIKI